MNKKNGLHPSVQQFKQFVKKHPLLIKEVREGRKTWQNFYEEWTILGEKDPIWEKYGMEDDQAEVSADKVTENEKNETGESKGGDLLGLLKNINLNDIQGHIENISGMMGSLQGLLQSFQSKSTNEQQQPSGDQQSQQSQNPPFNFRQF